MPIGFISVFDLTPTRNTPEFWLSELVQMRRYPGLLSADHLEHFCPQPIQLLGFQNLFFFAFCLGSEVS